MKSSLRRHLKKLRAGITLERRIEAEQQALDILSNLHGAVLSYMPIQSELNLTPLNQKLAKHGSLILPRIEQTSLQLYWVKDLQNQLLKGSFGIMEPNPQTCLKASPGQVSVALIPGLGFDRDNHRMGYGKGYFDRLLPELRNAELIGLGFKEQWVNTPLPIETHDHPLDRLMLF